MSTYTEPGRYITDVEFNNVLAEKFKEVTGDDVDIAALLKKLYNTAVDDYSYIRLSSNASLNLDVNGKTYNLDNTQALNTEITGSYYNLANVTADQVNSLSIKNYKTVFNFKKELPNLKDLSIGGFSGDSSLIKINFNNFKGSSLEKIYFYNNANFYLDCSLPEFIGDNLKNISVKSTYYDLFYKDDTIYLPQFTGKSLDKLENTYFKFLTKNAKKIYLPNFIGYNFRGLSFYESQIEEIIAPNFSPNNIKVFEFMGTKIKYIDFPKLSNGYSISLYFNDCSFLTYVNMPLLKEKEPEEYYKSSCFENCRNLLTVDLRSFSSDYAGICAWFAFCENLKSVNLSSFKGNTNGTDIASLFLECTNLEEVDLSSLLKLDTDYATSSFNSDYYEHSSNAFYHCESLKILKLNSLTGVLPDLKYCDILTDLYINASCFNYSSNKSNLSKINPGKLTVHVDSSNYKFKNNKWTQV